MEIKTKIRFQDCDPLGHLNNAKYIDYFINARSDGFLKHHNFDMYGTIQSHNAAWVIVQNQIGYMVPALQHEEITIQSNLIKLTKGSVIMEGVMYNNKDKINAILWTYYIFINLHTNKIMSHPPEIMEILRPILITPAENSDFNIRVREISSQFKENIIKV